MRLSGFGAIGGAGDSIFPSILRLSLVVNFRIDLNSFFARSYALVAMANLCYGLGSGGDEISLPQTPTLLRQSQIFGCWSGG